MKKKNLITAAVSLALVAVVGVGATLAYFTDKTDTKTNVFTSGHVQIELVDKSQPEEGQVGGRNTDDGVVYDKIMPGDVVSKIVGVESVIDSEEAWVAVRVQVNNVDMPYSEKEAEATQELYGLIEDQVDATAWSAVKELDAEENITSVVYYYNKPLNPFTENKAAQLFSCIEIPGVEWNNDYADMHFEIDVQAAAVQTRNVSLEAFKGMGWAALEALAD